MNLAEVLAKLEETGTETNRRIYRNHGAHEPMYGVSTANLKTLVKAIKKDHALAQALWETGNYDAQILATMISDPRAMTEAMIDTWVQSLNSYPLADYFSDIVFKTPFCDAKAQEWMNSEDEWLGRVGWHLVAKMAMDPARPDSQFEALLPVIEQEIHTRINRTRQAMLNALIAIGGRGGSLTEKTLEAAARIGPVDIDHGATACETPDAITYIKKMVARAEARAAKTPSLS